MHTHPNADALLLAGTRSAEARSASARKRAASGLGMSAPGPLSDALAQDDVLVAAVQRAIRDDVGLSALAPHVTVSACDGAITLRVALPSRVRLHATQRIERAAFGNAQPVLEPSIPVPPDRP